MEEPILNSHNKAEYEPAHTAAMPVTVDYMSREEAASIVDQ